jgi:hypothetical protein
MPINPGPVPNPLIPFFRAGGLKIVMRVAEEFGTGLTFINQFRRLYPKDPRATNEEYFGWLSYLNTVGKAGLQSGLDFQALDPTGGIDPNLFPANYFIKSPNPAEDRYLFNVSYESVNEETRQVRPFQMSVWFSELGPVTEMLNQIGDYIQRLIDIISVSASKSIRYLLMPGSLSIDSIFRRF